MTLRAALVPAVLTGGLVAGVFDTLYACVAYGLCGVAPFRNFQSAALSLLFHVLVLIAAAALFHALAGRYRRLAKPVVAAGFLYGACIYAAMAVVVVPHAASSYAADSRATGSCVEFNGPHGIRWSPNRLA